MNSMNEKNTIPRPEYPRPDFQRSEWLNLNGQWDFDFDDANVGETEGWYKSIPVNKAFTHEITVPFCFQSDKSGIHLNEMHEVMWYKRSFELPEAFMEKTLLLHFGAVDYSAKVWVNGEYAGVHHGGHVSFKLDITRYVTEGSNTLVVRAEDKYECSQPRGKQYWKTKPDRCWYTPTSGIWQTVWLEATGSLYLDRLRLTPDLDNSTVITELHLNRKPVNGSILVNISYKGELVKEMQMKIHNRYEKITLDILQEDYIDEVHHWTPEKPNLYDIKLVLCEGNAVQDTVNSYFGMRKIAVSGDVILLNNRPYYQKLILDQGYWPESLITPPSDEAIQYDIEMTKKFGFNGARKHQKIEDPRYYYWADRMGLLVWGELPSPYQFNADEIENVSREILEFINRDYNHPCIVTWVPLNESWGVRDIYYDKRQQNFARSLYYLIKAYDETRLVSTNDGWEQVISDINAIHDYVAYSEAYNKKYLDNKDKIYQEAAGGWRMLYAQNETYEGQPVIVTEYGGIAFASNSSENWGYGGAVRDEDSFFHRYHDITRAIQNTPGNRGYCYTQLTDVMQEINGLLTADRKPKVNVERVKEVNTLK